MNILFLGATFETSNMGVNVLTDGVICAALHQYPDAKLTVLDYGTEDKSYTFAYGGVTSQIPRVNMRFSKNPFLKNHVACLIVIAAVLRLLPFGRLKKALFAGNPVLKYIESADAIGAISGGDSFSDIYGYHRFFYVALPMVLVLLLGKKLILLPQTLGPFKGVVSQLVARWIITRAAIVYCRDHMGKDYIRSRLGSSAQDRIEFRYDVGFILPPERPAEITVAGGDFSAMKGLITVGLNISGLLYSGGYTGNNMFGLKADYRKLSEMVISFFLDSASVRVLLVPHVLGRKGRESDTTACEAVYENLASRYVGRLLLLQGSYNHREIKSVIGMCDFFVGSRMHACIAALSQGIPTISIAYSDKFHGVMQSIGFEQLVADPRHEDEESIVKTISLAYDDRRSLGKRIMAKMTTVKEESFGLYP